MCPSSDTKYVPALGFDWLTPYYDRIVGATTREELVKRTLVEQARIEPGQKVLDLACGTGTLAIRLKQSEPQSAVIGIDGDAAILQIASRKTRAANLEVRFVRAFSYKLPFADASFDVVTSSLFFHHLTPPDKQRTAREVFRVLKPGGTLHVADWGRAANVAMRGLFLLIQLLDGFETTRDNVRGKLIELFEQAGFCDVGEKRTFNTVFGTMALYGATKPR